MNEVFKIYSRQVARYLNGNFTMRPVDISEALQLTFIKAFSEEARTRYDGIRPFATYLITIAHNTAINELNRAWRKREASLENDRGTTEEQADTQGATPEKSLQSKEHRELFKRLDKKMTLLERDVCRLRFHEGCTQAEVSEQLGITRQTLRTTENKIRQKAYDIFVGSDYLLKGQVGKNSVTLTLMLIVICGRGL